ncbi:SusC/RagA family TonB-linked outer membrane protein [Dysgonomonas sp. Marseille-P4677]|uniref:SusC/RagA family TonB-linked outer membrane protein n=1 Tax=Dysgonomonas sp. Marseille-P4677 TaxID=2364790 RepID=UPI0019127B8B|nr:SusC/RagA family TonB-linked outer membrane protein [Dysgonomonas sp. Marseille-P4677]MBK5721825.1 SusC/RagA family TonB-linked outer membrane protein [Dysgonomonas sp. Marseille-P4677]
MKYFREKVKKATYLFTLNTIPYFLIFCFLFIRVDYVNADENQDSVKKITIEIKNKSLSEALAELEKKSEFLFFYQDEIVEKSKEKLNFKFENKTISEILNTLLANTENTFAINGRQLIIYKKPQKETHTTQRGRSFAIQGVVVDENGETLPGATVTVQGTNAGGTMTGENGQFSLIVDNQDINLIVSYIGYETQIVELRSSALIKLKPSSLQLEDVVVTGLFTRRAESYTGSTTSFTGKELLQVGNQNVIQSLKSLDPSLNIFTNFEMGSDPNTLPDMVIRGVSTFPLDESGMAFKSTFVGNPNAPLFILDGFETTLEKIINMDMSRIAGATILKDAAAKAIYGSKAANGVIIIETKRMYDNETRVTYNGSVSFQIPDLTSYDLTNALEKLRVEDIEGYYNAGTYLEDKIDNKQQYNERLRSALTRKSTYWLSKPLRTGVGTQHYIGVEMGEKNLKSIADFSYKRVDGVMKGSDNTTISGALNLSYRHKNVLFRNIMSIDDNKQNDSKYGNFNTYTMMNPYWDPYDATTGDLTRTFEGLRSNNEKIGNPLYDASLNTVLRNSYLHFSNNFYIEADLFKGLKAIGSISVSSQRLDDEEFYPSNHSMFLGNEYNNTEEARLKKGMYELTNGKSSSIEGKLNLQYNLLLNKHNFSSNTVFEIEEKSFNETMIQATGFPSNKGNNIGFARQYAENTVPVSYDALKRNMGFLENINYSYDDRFLTDLTLRFNGASVFGSDNPWGTFWSVGAGWNIHNENFMKGIKDLSMLKLRASYGTSGNQNANQNVSYATYRYFNSAFYQGFTGVILNNMENPFLRWEKSKDINLGLQFVYKGLSLVFDYYNTERSNLTTNLSVAPSIGFSTVSENIGRVRNRGIEVDLGYTVIQNKEGFLNIRGKIATNNNKIVEISEALRAFNKRQMEKAEGTETNRPVLIYQDGMPMNAIWAVPSLGIDPMTGCEIFRGQDGNLTYVWKSSDMVYSGSQDPKYRGNVSINGEYKGFGLTLNGTFLGGGKMYNYTLVDKVENVDIKYNVDRRVLTGRWQTPGQNAQYSILARAFNPETNKTQDNVTRATTRFIQDRNEFTISSISAYYNVSGRLLEMLKMKQLRFTFYLNDIATFSSIKVERGTNYPFARNMSFSITGTF